LWRTDESLDARVSLDFSVASGWGDWFV
jgi:hypothetical protein